MKKTKLLTPIKKVSGHSLKINRIFKLNGFPDFILTEIGQLTENHDMKITSVSFEDFRNSGRKVKVNLLTEEDKTKLAKICISEPEGNQSDEEPLIPSQWLSEDEQENSDSEPALGSVPEKNETDRLVEQVTDCQIPRTVYYPNGRKKLDITLHNTI